MHHRYTNRGSSVLYDEVEGDLATHKRKVTGPPSRSARERPPCQFAHTQSKMDQYVKKTNALTKCIKSVVDTTL